MPLVFSSSIENKEEFSLDETALFQVKGTFSQTLNSNFIKFYRGHVEVPFNFEIKKLGDYYFIWAKTSGKEQNNYSITIEGINHYVSGELTDEKISSNFTINSNQADFSVEPAFANTKTFSLTFKSFLDDPSTISYSFEEGYELNKSMFDQENNFTLQPGEEKSIEFDSGSLFGLNTLFVSSENSLYLIPIHSQENILCGNGVINLGELCDTDNLGEINSCEDLGYDSGDIYCSDDCDFDVSGCSYENENNTQNKNETCEGDNCLENVLPECSESEDCKGESQECIGGICVSAQTEKLCSDSNGTICGYDETCLGETQNIGSNVCCLAECEETKGSSSGKLVGWSLLIIVLAIIAWLFMRYKSTK